MSDDDFTAKLMDDMPADLLDFVKTKVNSFIKWDLIRFFYENPNTIDTAENIAKYAGRHLSAVAPELEDLEVSGIMDRKIIGDQVVYSLTQDHDMRNLVDNFIVACEDRHFRVKAVYHIIRGMQ
ncbi:MAG: hypothetical protein B6243_00055 [Anaerolineaceae bacterium 4572_5.2]|nr:MAG: hypothetical protein B6243_00055 [Anaerolineaceae bacterium 4572_5.2]